VREFSAAKNQAQYRFETLLNANKHLCMSRPVAAKIAIEISLKSLPNNLSKRKQLFVPAKTDIFPKLFGSGPHRSKTF
jgi:hypothetical protein